MIFSVIEFVVSAVLTSTFGLILLLPGWWLAGRVTGRESDPFLRLLLGVGLGLGAYLSFVNLAGRLTENSISSAWAYLAVILLAGVLFRRAVRRELAELRSLCGRRWLPPVLLAVALGCPQWLFAVSTNYWDETASSAIHVTGANQFAEGLFPPRHNAFPEVATKYHYGSIILAGTAKWLTGLSANVSIDLTSTFLWLFIFLFSWHWLKELGFGTGSRLWGSFSVLMGGNLTWLYVPWLEAYKGGIYKTPSVALQLHSYAPDDG